jgi:hypothetical protein
MTRFSLLAFLAFTAPAMADDTRCLVTVPQGECRCETRPLWRQGDTVLLWTHPSGDLCPYARHSEHSTPLDRPVVVDPIDPPPPPPTGCDGGHDRDCDGVGGDPVDESDDDETPEPPKRDPKPDEPKHDGDHEPKKDKK